MALKTSVDEPAEVRVIANLVGQYINRLGAVWVKGQVTEMSPRRPGMTKVFLTLRDEVADVSISLSASRTVIDSLNPPLVEGASIIAHAKLLYYANRGRLSLEAREIRMVGLGELLAQIERRRQLLAAEGIFAAEHKRRLPFLPTGVGLVTAPNSAAERDVVENAQRRWRGVRLKTAYAAMQGPRSAAEVIDAMHRLQADPDIDVIVVARGGGSVEDLLPFSDEGLLRAVFALTKPVVSAIGHEPDSPLLDLVADVRASTPTDAAKLVVPDVATELASVGEARQRLFALLRNRIDQEVAGLAALCSRPALANVDWVVASREEEIAQLRGRAERTVRHALDRAQDEIAQQSARVRALSPLATLARGYAVVQNSKGQVLTSPAQTSPRSALTITVHEGAIAATVKSVQTRESNHSSAPQDPAPTQEDP